ncbi:hypothetical protein D3C87_2058300 [compost metagenome]
MRQAQRLNTGIAHGQGTAGHRNDLREPATGGVTQLKAFAIVVTQCQQPGIADQGDTPVRQNLPPLQCNLGVQGNQLPGISLIV